MVTGELAPIKGKGIMTLTVGGRSMYGKQLYRTPVSYGWIFEGAQEHRLPTRSRKGHTVLPWRACSHPPPPPLPLNGCLPFPTSVCDFPPLSPANCSFPASPHRCVTPLCQNYLWQLLFRDSFSLSEGEVVQTHLVQHEIYTGTLCPSR